MNKAIPEQFKQLLASKAEAVYRYMVLDHTGNWAMDMNAWDWVPGVGAASILTYYKATGNEAVKYQLLDWVDRNKSKAFQVRVVNSMAPFAIFPDLHRLTGERLYRDQAIEIADWMVEQAPRAGEGAFEHTFTEADASYPKQIWADTIYMAVLFLSRIASLTGNKTYAYEALHQLDVHFKALQDPETGVLYHGWDTVNRNHMSGAKWARANAWVALAAPLIIEQVRDVVRVPQEIIDAYGKLMRGLISFRAADGLWHTVLDRPDFYKEASGSAGIAAGLYHGVRVGCLEPAAADGNPQTLKSLLSLIVLSGAVRQVSTGTPVMPTVDAYNRIELTPTLYGQGLMLELLSAYLSDV